MELLDFIKMLFKPKEKIDLVRLDEMEIKEVLPKIDYKVLNPAKYYIIDEDYKTCSITDFKKLLKANKTNWNIYRKDYDCDNFAFKLSADLKNQYPMLAVGIVFSVNHAFNIFIDKNKKVWYIEPQNDKVYSSNVPDSMKDISLIIV